MLIDWNGNVYLCPQDWQRKVPMGNVMQETLFKVCDEGEKGELTSCDPPISLSLFSSETKSIIHKVKKIYLN